MTVALPPLPPPDFYVSEDTLNHGMRRCFKTEHQVKQYGKQEWYLYVWTHASVQAYARAAVALALSGSDVSEGATK